MKILVTIHDAKAGYYYDPKVIATKGEAIRAFINEVNNPESDFCKDPSSYTLFELGTYDEQECKFELLGAIYPLARAIDYVKSDNVASLAVAK